jgi:dTMP kinase
MQPGIFISLDGVDGAGKSTQCRLLVDWLLERSFDVTRCADPGGTPVGDELRQLLLGHRHELTLPCEAFLFMASRAQLVDQIIRPALDAGRIVVCDRFLLANVVYQGHAGGIDPKKLWDIGAMATGGLQPDLTIVLDLAVDAAHTRRVAPPDRLESREPDFHRRVRAGFLCEAKRDPQRIRVVDAALPIERVHELIRTEVTRVLDANPRA